MRVYGNSVLFFVKTLMPYFQQNFSQSTLSSITDNFTIWAIKKAENIIN